MVFKELFTAVRSIFLSVKNGIKRMPLPSGLIGNFFIILHREKFMNPYPHKNEKSLCCICYYIYNSIVQKI